VTVPDVPRPIDGDLGRATDASRGGSWFRRILVVAALSFPIVASAGGSARASTVTGSLDGPTDVVGEAAQTADTGAVSDTVRTGTLDGAISSASDQLTADAPAPIRQAVDERVASVKGTVEGIERAAKGAVEEASGAISDAGSGLDTVPTLGTASSDPNPSRGSAGGSPNVRVRHSLEALAPIANRLEARSSTTWATPELGAPVTDPNAAEATSSSSSGRLGSPKPEPVGAPAPPVSMADGVGHTVLLMLIGLCVAALAHASPGLRRNRPPPSVQIPLVLVLSLERPG
jgi:hypothetical protein